MLYRFLLLLFIISVFLLSLCKIEDTDTWTHLSFGRLILEEKSLPSTEPFVYPSVGKSAEYFSWFFGVLFYAAFALFQEYGVIFLKAMIITGVFFILLKDSLRPHKNFGVAVLILTFIVIGTRYRFVERPDILMMAFLSFTVFSLNAYWYDCNKKFMYFLPLIHLVWANTHPSIILMVVPFLSFIGGGLLEHGINRKKPIFYNTPALLQIRFIAVIFLISFACSLINPYFIREYTAGLSVLGGEWWTQEVVELSRPTWETAPIVFILSGCLLVSFLLNIKNISLVNLFLVIPFLILSFSALRFIFLLCILSGPMLVRNISSFLESVSWRKIFSSRIMTGLTALWVIGYVPLTLTKTINPYGEWGKNFGLGVEYSVFPEGALQFMDQQGITGKILNVFHWGGYITWRDFPERKVFVDGRGNLDKDLLEKMIQAREAPSVLDDLEKKYGFDSVLVDYPLKTIDFDLRDQAFSHPQWALIYWDDLSLVYVKRGGPYDDCIQQYEYRFIKPANGLQSIRGALRDPAISVLLFQEIKRNIEIAGSSKGYAFLGFAYNELGLYSEAIESFSHVRDVYLSSQIVHAYFGIARAYEAQSRYHDAVKYYKKALTLDNDPAILYSLGKVYNTMGDKQKALLYLEKALTENMSLPAVYPLLFTLYQEIGKYGDAADIQNKYSNLMAKNSGEEHFKKGLHAYFEKRFEDALEEFGKSIRIQDSNPASYSNIGYIYYDMGDIRQAYEFQKKALEVDPYFANAHYGLSLISRRWKDYEKEKKYLQEYLKLQPSGYYSRRATERIKALARKDDK